MTMKAIFLTVVCLTVFVGSACAQTPAQLFSEAKAAEASGKRDTAFLLYRQIVRQYPESQHAEEALFLIAQYHYDARNYFDADQAFRDHLRMFPQSRYGKEINSYISKIRLRSLKDRADSLFAEGKLGPASILYEQYLQNDPDNAEVKSQLERITQTQQQVHFGFEQLHRERKKLEEERAELSRKINVLEDQQKQVLAMKKQAEEMNKTTVARYEQQLAAVSSQAQSLEKGIADLVQELRRWRQRAVLAEAIKLSQPLPRRFEPVAGEKATPQIIFEGARRDPSPEQNEAQVSNMLREGFPVIVVTEVKLDTQSNLRHVETVVIADLNSSWPDGAKLKYRVDLTAREGKPAPDPAFIVRYYDVSDMDEIDESTKSYRKRILFTVEEDKVSRYEVSAFLVKSQ